VEGCFVLKSFPLDMMIGLSSINNPINPSKTHSALVKRISEYKSSLNDPNRIE
jgi:hypothetical protein